MLLMLLFCWLQLITHGGFILQALDLGLDQFPDPADLLDCFDTDAIPTNDDDILTMLSS